MKKLRVLTGRHAGSELILDASISVISGDPEDDIQISDWTEAPITICIHEDGSDNPAASLRLDEEGNDVSLADFAPRAFGPVVLCAGPVGGAWPPDIELLERMLRPKAAAPSAAQQPDSDRAAAKGRRWWPYGAAASAAAALLGGLVLVIRNGTPEPAPISPLAMAVKVLQGFELPEVSVRSEGSGVIVEGIVPDPMTANRLRQAFTVLPRGAVKDRIVSASEVAQTIADTLGVSGISVRYAQRGRFVVQGAAVGAKKLAATAERLASEMHPLVTGITLAVDDLPPPPTMPTGAMMSAAGVEYVQSRDGTKHIALVRRLEPDITGAVDSPFPQPRSSERSSQ